MNLSEFGRCMAVMIAGIGKPMSTEQAQVYFDMLKDLTVEQLQIGVKRALCEHEFATIPSIALLRKLALETDSGAECVKACERVMSAQRHAYYESGKAREIMGDARTIAAMEAIGGMSRLAELTTDQNASYLAQFRTAYDKLEHAEKRERVMAGPGIGFSDETKKLAQSMKGIE